MAGGRKCRRINYYCGEKDQGTLEYRKPGKKKKEFFGIFCELQIYIILFILYYCMGTWYTSFKGLGMINLQYEMRICQKCHSKATKTVYVWFEFLWIRRYANRK